METYGTFVPAAQFVLHFILPVPAVLLFIAGWVIGALLYDGMHLSYHFNVDLSWIPGWQKMKDQHMRHHFRDNSKEFGVITDLWDNIYGTKKGKKND